MRLSAFKDEKAIEVVAALLEPLGKITQNEEIQELHKKGMKSYEFAATALKTNASEIKKIFAILNDKDPEDYHCDAVSILRDTITLISDADLMELFGFQRQTPPSSGSVSETTEGQNK